MTKAQQIQAAGEHREQLLSETRRLLDEIDAHLELPEPSVRTAAA